MEERDLADGRAVTQGLEVRRIGERDTEVPRVEARRFLAGRPGLGEMADQLIAEEIQRYPVWVTAGELGAEQAHVEVLSRIQIMHGYG